MKNCDVLIVGGGAAGISVASVLGKEHPELEIILIEREDSLGGVLGQCIHHGFGMASFGKELTGPEYARRLEERLLDTNITIMLKTEAVKIILPSEDEAPEVVTASTSGWEKIRFRQMILAAGCYERPYGNLLIAGTRPEGIFGAGQLQRMMNLEGYQPAKTAVVIGSGDIGLIVSRRLQKKKTIVKRVVEIQEKSPALERNQRRCIQECHLPLMVQSQVVQIHGEERICGVTVQNNLTGEREYISCDMLVVAAGLLPDRSLLEELPEEWERWITLAGNCDKIYPIADAIVNAAEEICHKMLGKMI